MTKSSNTIHAVDIIRHKCEGLPLTTAEIQAFIRGIVDRTISDAQATSLLTAIFLLGLNPQELADLTSAMRFSGEVFDATPLHTFTIDKHSTGGVGDKTSLLIAPIVAAAGLASPTPAGVPGICVPMISGRSLGHTGGTLDKLETIPGFNTQLTLQQFFETLKSCGASLIGQTPTLVPADRILYALRDHTGTIESPNLITASIMSKKLAESLNALVLDVKTGSGAFMKSYDDSRHLANLMVQTGTLAGTRTVALITQMDQPLGRFSGNWVEVWECVDIMKQVRHPLSADLIELTNALSGWMLHLAGKAATPEAGAALSNEILKSGAAYQAWLKIVEAHHGDTSVFADPAAFHKPTATRTLKAETSGYLASMDCTEVGWAVQRLGAGRLHPGDPVSAHAGIEMHIKLGDKVEPNQPLITLFSEDPTLLTEPYEMLRATLQLSPTPPTLQPLIRETITDATSTTQ
ncbi:thymidine phosphorylase [Granulicella sp. dw_53]|uniref:thymidine phosphorylase n=1 Tax=Granulicella sp. dw_53 TaxID=2719792 RepID=UPI001BD452FA|nr:thymidine phosphorylase [Granulicella sp. dw_53]